MHRTDGANHAANMFVDGDPGVPTIGTRVEEDWLNAVQEELINILTEGAVTPVKGTNTQVLEGLRAVLVPRTASAAADYTSNCGKQRVVYRKLTSGTVGTSEIWFTVNAAWNGTAWAKDQQSPSAVAVMLGCTHDTSGPAYATTIRTFRQLASVATFADADWLTSVPQTAIGVTSPWADSGGSLSVGKYWMNALGETCLQGTVSHGGGGSGPTVDPIATLPAAYRPLTDLRFTTSYLDTTYKHCTILITSAGVITSDAAIGAQVRLDGIRFPSAV